MDWAYWRRYHSPVQTGAAAPSRTIACLSPQVNSTVLAFPCACVTVPSRFCIVGTAHMSALQQSAAQSSLKQAFSTYHGNPLVHTLLIAVRLTDTPSCTQLVQEGVGLQQADKGRNITARKCLTATSDRHCNHPPAGQKRSSRCQPPGSTQPDPAPPHSGATDIPRMRTAPSIPQHMQQVYNAMLA